MLPTGVIDPNGSLTKYTWDADGNQLSRTEGINAVVSPMVSGRTGAFTYDTAHHGELLTSQNPVQAAASVVTAYTYDGNGNLLDAHRAARRDGIESGDDIRVR